MGKIAIGRERLSHFLVLGKLQAVVISDGVDLVLARSKSLFNTFSYRLSLFGAVAALTTVALQFPADGGFMDSDIVGNG